ncbi:hypothetical protein [Solilutibacter pythonis]|nr:hypothetical protein [Lysobacter pythonis]
MSIIPARALDWRAVDMKRHDDAPGADAHAKHPAMAGCFFFGQNEIRT